MARAGKADVRRGTSRPRARTVDELAHLGFGGDLPTHAELVARAAALAAFWTRQLARLAAAIADPTTRNALAVAYEVELDMNGADTEVGGKAFETIKYFVDHVHLGIALASYAPGEEPQRCDRGCGTETVKGERRCSWCEISAAWRPPRFIRGAYRRAPRRKP